MLKYLFVILMLSMVVLAEDNFIQIQNTSFTQGSTLDRVTSVFGKTEYTKSPLDGDLDIEAGITGNIVLKKNAINNFFVTINDTNFLIHKLSATYYTDNFTMVSVGREDMKLNLLNGSFDGILMASSFNDIFIKAFYFNHYTYLLPTINHNKKLYDMSGLSVNYSKGYFDTELTYFQENGEQRSSIYLGFLNNPYKFGIEQMQFLSSVRGDEKALKVHAGIKYKQLYVEVGALHVYTGLLKNIYDFGGSEFNAFRLTSYLNSKNAENRYLSLVYNHEPFYAKLYIGNTNFSFKADVYLKREKGLTLWYKNGKFQLNFQFLTQKSNQMGYLGERFTWANSSLEYRF